MARFIDVRGITIAIDHSDVAGASIDRWTADNGRDCVAVRLTHDIQLVNFDGFTPDEMAGLFRRLADEIEQGSGTDA